MLVTVYLRVIRSNVQLGQHKLMHNVCSFIDLIIRKTMVQAKSKSKSYKKETKEKKKALTAVYFSPTRLRRPLGSHGGALNQAPYPFGLVASRLDQPNTSWPISGR